MKKALDEAKEAWIGRVIRDAEHNRDMVSYNGTVLRNCRQPFMGDDPLILFD